MDRYLVDRAIGFLVLIGCILILPEDFSWYGSAAVLGACLPLAHRYFDRESFQLIDSVAYLSIAFAGFCIWMGAAWMLELPLLNVMDRGNDVWRFVRRSPYMTVLSIVAAATSYLLYWSLDERSSSGGGEDRR